MKTESVDLEGAFHEDQEILFTYYAVRDHSTGCWDMTDAIANGFYTTMGGAKHTWVPFGDIDSQADRNAVRREAEKHWHRAEELLERQYQESLPVDGFDPTDERI